MCQKIIDSIHILELDLKFEVWGDLYCIKHWKRRRRRERKIKLARMSGLVANLLDRLSSSTVRPKTCNFVLHQWWGDDEFILMEPNSPFMKALRNSTGFEEVFVRVSVTWALWDNDEDYTGPNPLSEMLKAGLEQTLGEVTIFPLFAGRVPVFCLVFYPRKFAESSKKRIEEA